MRFVILIALLGLTLAYKNQKKYNGYKVLSIKPETTEQLDLLRSWRDRFDFWLEPTVVGREVHLMVPPQHMNYVSAKLLAGGTKHSVHIMDVQRHIDDGFADIEALRAKRPDTMVFDYNNYNTFTDFLAEYDQLIADCPVGWTCSKETIGTSVEGRPMVVLKLTRNNAPTPRYAIWYDSQIHAREWLSGATLMRVIDKIWRGTDAEGIRFRESYDWYFLPIMNPDGYEYSWAADGDRLWRKNRSNNGDPPCSPVGVISYGTDLNRNWPYHWGQVGSRDQPCADTYNGNYSMSEPETSSVYNYAATIRSNLVAWINFHTYGPYWLTPWGDCTVPTDHTSHQLPVANAAADAAEATGGQTWPRGNSCQVLYETSGSIIDSIKDAFGVRWTHTPELRGNSFVVPPTQIEPSFQEVWAAVTAKLDTMESIGLP